MYNVDKSKVKGLLACLLCFAPLSLAAVTITPSGDTTGVTDQSNLEVALATNSPGGTVSLKAGTFYINKAVSSNGFNGIVKGAGKNNTIIMGVGTEANPFQSVDVLPGRLGPAALYTNLNTYFAFADPKGNVIVKDMAMRVPENFVLEVSGGNGNSIVGYLDQFVDVRFRYNQANTTFKNVDFVGGPSSSFFVYSPFIMVGVFGDGDPEIQSPAGGRVYTSGTHTFSNNSVTNCFYPYYLKCMKNATVDVSWNTITNYGILKTMSLDGSTVSIKNNNMTGGNYVAALRIGGEGNIFGALNTIYIKDNNIETRGFYAMELDSPENAADPALARLQYSIENNTITMQLGGSFFPFPLIGINMIEGDNDLIKCNTLNGTAFIGVLLDGTSNSSIKSNDLRGFAPLVLDGFPPGVDYVLSNVNPLFGGPSNQCANNNIVDVVGQPIVVDECTGNTITYLAAPKCP